MKNNPCKTCLVKACCGINKKIQIYKCGCDPYEIYKSEQLLIRFSDHGSYMWQNVTKRLKELRGDK
jgi:hypothetical protein